MCKYQFKFDYCNKLAEKMGLQLIVENDMVKVIHQDKSWLIGIDYLISFLSGYYFCWKEGLTNAKN